MVQPDDGLKVTCSMRASDLSDEHIPPGMEDVLHWVDGELLIRPQYKVRQDAEQRRTCPPMTELQIQESWGFLAGGFGIGVDTRLLSAGKAMLAALEAGDGRAALAHFNEASRLDPVAAEGLVRDTRRRLSPGGAAARWLYATRRSQEMIAALEAGDQPRALENLLRAARVEPGVAAGHVEVARKRGLL